MVFNSRILNIRKHKNITFLDCYTGECGKVQFMIYNNLLNNYDINCGDYIKLEASLETNDDGNYLYVIKGIFQISKAADWNYYKGLNNKQIDVKQSIHFNAMNAGSQLKVLQYKKNILEKIKIILANDNFEDMTMFLNVVERYKNGSNVIDAELNNRKHNQPKYLRSTFENQLKQACSILLKSVYSIDKAFRNMGENSGHINEFLLLELVSIDYTLDDMINFIYKMDACARNEYCIISDKCDKFVSKLEVIDYNDIYVKSSSLDKILSSLDNILILNYPANSPFIKINNEGIQVETRWYMRGKYIGHFYEDENDTINVMSSIYKQMDLNKLEDKDINPLNYFDWGLPNTVSFGVSIDRWLQLLLNETNINKVANPIGLDYTKAKKRR